MESVLPEPMRGKLRRGVTTGGCAALAAYAAASLLAGRSLPAVSLRTPGGETVQAEVLDPHLGDGEASCAVRKDAGDDPDVTNGLLIAVRVRLTDAPGVRIDGGEGVGRVTLPGLDQPVGAAAINRTPRAMIEAAVCRAFREGGLATGAEVVVSIPGGEEIAKKTFNPRLGIVGGLSVLGTTGIVEPMSESALLETIRAELSVRRAAGDEITVVVPGHYGERFLASFPSLRGLRPAQCSNFVGEAIDMAAQLGFSGLLLTGHIGKFVKLAAGIFNTHSRYGDGRMEILTAHAAMAGADAALAAALMASSTTDAALALLQDAKLTERVCSSLLEAMDRHVRRRAGDGMQAGILLYHDKYGFLGMTPQARALLGRLGVNAGKEFF